jgi:hypothetical protein
MVTENVYESGLCGYRRVPLGAYQQSLESLRRFAEDKHHLGRLTDPFVTSWCGDSAQIREPPSTMFAVPPAEPDRVIAGGAGHRVVDARRPAHQR